MKLEEIVRNALVAEGVAMNNWKINIKAHNTGSVNSCRLEIEVYEPRCRKPSTIWEAPFDMTRNHLYWCNAKLVYNKAF